jgi:hypothetical protein
MWLLIRSMAYLTIWVPQWRISLSGCPSGVSHYLGAPVWGPVTLQSLSPIHAIISIKVDNSIETFAQTTADAEAFLLNSEWILNF